MNRLATPVISALMGFIESKEDELILESLDSLAKIFDNVSEEFVSPVLVNVCLRLKPAFENVSGLSSLPLVCHSWHGPFFHSLPPCFWSS